MSFAKDVLLRPFPIVWGVTTGALGIAAFFGMDNQVTFTVKLLTSFCIFFLISCVGLLVIAHELHRRTKAPVSVRSIVEGTHFYQGNLIIILDKSNWIEIGQLLVLVAVPDGVQLPLALIQVETQTTEGFPQCVVVVPLTKAVLGEYLSDKSRWRSLSVLSEIKSRYLEAPTNG